MSANIPLSEPYLGRRESREVKRAVDSGWLTQQGSQVRNLERNLYDYFKSRIKNDFDVTSTSNGTTALHLALLSIDIKEGDEVIIPNFCYVAVLNAVLYCKGTPVCVDVSPGSWNIDPDEVKRAITEKTRAIICVDNYGHPSNVSEIRRNIPENIVIIQDSAESFPDPLGSTNLISADLITLSMYANKIITSGEGGAVIGSRTLVSKIKELKNQSQDPNRKFNHVGVGYNYRMTNLHAAVFNAQWSKKNKILRKRKRVFEDYLVELSKVSFNWTTNFTSKSSPWLFTIQLHLLNTPTSVLIKELGESGIETRPGFNTITELAFAKKFVRKSGHGNFAENLSASVISLPTYPRLTRSKIRRIVKTLEKAINDRG
jgi:perosamine synthetase